MAQAFQSFKNLLLEVPDDSSYYPRYKKESNDIAVFV
jgi:hypothetical protein